MKKSKMQLFEMKNKRNIKIDRKEDELHEARRGEQNTDL
jgi:hypothetical protein